VVLWHIGPAPTRVVDRNGYRRFDEPMSSPEALFDRLFDRVKTDLTCACQACMVQAGGRRVPAQWHEMQACD
jgi:hypothetical protein